MSRLGLSAVLVALLSATAASACCFFKCCWKPAPYPYVTPGGDPRLHPAVLETTGSSLSITSVDGQAPVSGSIPNPVNHPKIDVVVYSEFDPSVYSHELTVTELEFATAKAAAKKLPVKKPPVKYKPKKIVKKPKPKKVGPASVISPAPAPGPDPDPVPDPAYFWEVTFEVDVVADRRYSAYATAGSAASSSVNFQTKP